MPFRGGPRRQCKSNEAESPPVTDYVGVPSTSSSNLPKKPVGRHQLPAETPIPPPIIGVSNSPTKVITRPFTGPHVVTSLHSTPPRSSSSSAATRMTPGARWASSIVNVRSAGMSASSSSPPINVTVPPAVVPAKTGVINGGNGPIIGVTTVPKSPVRAQSFAAQPNIPFTCFPAPTPITGDASPNTRDRIFSRSQSASENNHSTLHQPLEYLFFGSFENAANTRWLCSNRIAYVVNLTGTPRIKARGCNCGESDKYHKQFECTKKIDPTTKTETIVKDFKEINEFIAEARTNGFKVLIFNEDGEDLCLAVAIQHIMVYYNLGWNEAHNHITRTCDVRIRVSEPYMAALRALEQELANKHRKTTGASTSSSTLKNPLFHDFAFKKEDSK